MHKYNMTMYAPGVLLLLTDFRLTNVCETWSYVYWQMCV